MDETLLSELEAAIQSGTAAAQVITLCLARMQPYARRMLQRHAGLRRHYDADDLLQSAAIRMHRVLQRNIIESPRHALALAMIQVKREFIDVLRSHTASPQRNVGDRDLDKAAVHDLGLQAWEEFHAAVNGLPKPQRDAVHALWYRGLSQEDAAKLLGITDRTLRRHWTAARKSLSRRLNAADFFGA